MSQLGTDPRGELAALQQRARKRFGQHFLQDLSIVERIVRSARLSPGDRVVEIGPGLGILTGALLRAEAALLAVELDRDLAAYLRERVPELDVLEADAAKVDWAETCPGSGWKVVANLPYNVGTTVTMQLLRCPGTFTSVTVMLQLEVVQRLCADPGSRAFGALTVESRARARPTFVTTVEPGCFHPAPKVRSAVVRFDLLEAPETGGADPARFDQTVRAAFAHRRKTILNSLQARYGRETAAAALDAAGIDPRARAEQLELVAFGVLARALHGPAG